MRVGNMGSLVWNLWAVPAYLVLVMAWGMGAFVYLARPEGSANRRLAIQLFFEGVVVCLLTSGTWIFTDPGLVYALLGVGIVAVWIKLWSYFNFLATLDTPLARPLRPPVASGIFLGITVLASLSWFLWPHSYFLGVVPTPYAPWVGIGGPEFFLTTKVWAVLWLLGLVLGFSALRHARTQIRRRQTRAYVLAFGTRDVLFALWAVALAMIPPTSPIFVPFLVGATAIWIAYIPFVGYAILRTQLFDIDLKLKTNIKRATIAAAFFVAFFAASESTEALVSDAAGPVGGIAAAGALAIGLKPVERFADRVAGTIMPGIDNSPSHASARKHEVYRAAVEACIEDGRFTPKERLMLDRLRDKLGLHPAEAEVLEADVKQILGTPASSVVA